MSEYDGTTGLAGMAGRTEALRAWLDQAGIGTGDLRDLRRMSGGTQNLLLSFSRGRERLVLRRPPAHPRPHSNRSLLREARVLGALAGSAIPHPRLRGVCTDLNVLGDVMFVVMDEVEGVNPVAEAPSGSERAAYRAEMARNACRVLARVGELDHAALGLGDLGSPEGFLERQTRRWMAEFESYRTLPGYASRPLPHMESVTAYLDAGLPAAAPPGLMHGDYHLGNLLVRHGSTEVAAVLDWEMTTVGDPLLDLGRFLATWPDHVDSIEPRTGIWAQGAMPDADELVAAYAECSTRSLESLEWYVVLGCYKLAIILEGTHARACAGQAPPEVGDRLHDAALRLFDRANRYITGQSRLDLAAIR